MDQVDIYKPGQYNRIIIFLSVVIFIFYIIVTIYSSLTLFYITPIKTGKSDYVAENIIECQTQPASGTVQQPIQQPVQQPNQQLDQAPRKVSQNGSKLRTGSNPYRKGN